MFQKEIEDKSADLKEKILVGKISSYISERSLLSQPFIKDSDKTINDLITEAIQKFGERIEIRRFARFSTLLEGSIARTTNSGNPSFWTKWMRVLVAR